MDGELEERSVKLGTAVRKEVFTAPEGSTDLVIPLAKVGIEIEFERWSGWNETQFWDNHPDDSLRNDGQEFVSRGNGLVGASIPAAVEEFCKQAIKRKWDVGTPRAGIHIHVDCTDLDISRGELATFISLYMLFEHALFGYAGEWRRSCGFCDAFEDSDSDFAYLGRAMFDKRGTELRNALTETRLHKYQAVNILPLSRFGTIEFRHLPTTFDSRRIMEWINFILQLKRATPSFDLRVPLIAQFSREGARTFCERVMGEMWPAIAPFFREDMAWNAIDNAIALMSYAKLIVPKEQAVPAVDRWAEGYVAPKNWVTEKLEAMSKAPKKEQPASAAEPVAAGAGVEDPFSRLLREANWPVVPQAEPRARAGVATGGAVVRPTGRLFRFDPPEAIFANPPHHDEED